MMHLEKTPGHLIRRLHQMSGHVFQQHMQKSGYDITPVQFATMQALKSSPGIEQSQLASEIAYDPATIGGVISRLEQKGWVTRHISDRDRRAREVSLSATGTGVFKKIAPVVAALQKDILGNLSEKECQSLTSLLQKAVGSSA